MSLLKTIDCKIKKSHEKWQKKSDKVNTHHMIFHISLKLIAILFSDN